MKLLLVVILLLSSMALSAQDEAVFPNQPRLSNALTQLVIAQKMVEGALQGQRPDMRVKRAVNSLTAARRYMENVTLNKGSARVASLREIDSARKELDTGTDTAHLKQAAEHIQQAIKHVNRAGESGRN
ncbi:MAG TPA: hypothetical protein VGE39_05515 [Prosthecobacter sp.]